MLEKDAVRRPRDGAAVLSGLLVVQAELAPPEAGGPAAGLVRIQPPWRRWVAPALGTTAALLLAAGLVAGWLEWRRAAEEVEEVPSVAVLPFLDLSEAHDQRFLSDGLSEEIVVALARIEGLRVTGQRSADRFRAPAPDLRRVGRDLGVATVLEGSVRRDGERMRVTATLVQSADGRHLWSRTFQRPLTDLFAVQDEIAGAVVQALKVKLLGGRSPSTQLHRTASPEAYAHYLLGRQLVREDRTPAFRMAVAAFRRALAFDPTYAPAWAGLSQALFWGFANVDGTAADMRQAGQDAMAAAEQAVVLAPELAEGYASRGFLRAGLDADWIGARSDLERAVELEPGGSEILIRYARSVLAPMGQLEEARAAARLATRLDPLSNSAWTSLAAILLASGDLEGTRRAARRSMELQPTQSFAATYLAMAELADGHPEAALAAAEQCDSPIFKLQVQAVALHSMGRKAESQAVLDLMVRERQAEGQFQIATVYAWRGDKDQAFAWLERALAAHDGGLMDLRLDPLVKGLASDPRFNGILTRLHLPTE
jgi:serine/threonine-protein kinase